MKLSARGAVAVVLGLGALALLADQAVAHPELRLPDFVPFATRARRLLEGEDWLSPRYPVGYPLALALSKLATGTVWVGGRSLAVLSGGLAVLVAARWLGPVAGLWLLASPALLEFGATAGTDMPAVALALAALAVARPGREQAGAAFVAGLLAGAAAMCRYPAALVVPVVLLALLPRAPERGKALALALVGVALATLPHWGAALAGAGPLLPDPTENAAIGAGAVPQGALARLGGGVRRAAGLALSTWPARIGAVGLLAGLLRRDGRAVALLSLGGLHLGLLGFFFANDRLVLPATVVATLGVAFLMPRRARGFRVLAPVAGMLSGAILLWRAVPAARQVGPAELARAEIVDAARPLPGRFASSSPWFYLPRADGWIEAPVLLKAAVPAGASPGGMQPDALLGWARGSGIRYVVLDVGRVQRTYPALKPMLSAPPAGTALVARSQGWRLFDLDPSAP